MIEKIPYAKFGRPNENERLAFISEAERMIKEYGWEDKSVHPWSYPVKIVEIIDDIKDYDHCSKGSQDYLVTLANGLGEILNEWERREKLPKVRIKCLKDGKIKELPDEDAELFLSMPEYFVAVD